MIDSIIDLIKTDISTLSWIDKIGGVVTPLKIKKKNGTATIEKIIPVCYNDSKTTCEISDYIDYCPNSKFKSVSYFEVTSMSELDRFSKYSTYEADIRFVCWVNLPLINSTLTPDNTLLYEVLTVLPKKISNTTPFVFASITGLNISRNADIFNAYSYDEAENQYLIYPFDYFAINMTLTFRVPNCVTPVTLNPSLC